MIAPKRPRAISWSLAIYGTLCLTVATASSQQVTIHATVIKHINESSTCVMEFEGMLARQEQIIVDSNNARLPNSGSTAS